MKIVNLKKSILSIAVLSTLLCTPVFASPENDLLEGQSKMTQELMQYDTNKDGIITAAEKAAAKVAEFAAADTDADTFLSWDEFQAAVNAKRAARLQAMFAVADADGNGALSSDEYVAVFGVDNASKAATKFALIDADGDAALSLEELSAALSDHEPAVELMEKFARMDTNGDSKLDASEYGAKSSKQHKPSKPRHTKDAAKSSVEKAKHADGRTK